MIRWEMTGSGKVGEAAEAWGHGNMAEGRDQGRTDEINRTKAGLEINTFTHLNSIKKNLIVPLYRLLLLIYLCQCFGLMFISALSSEGLHSHGDNNKHLRLWNK